MESGVALDHGGNGPWDISLLFEFFDSGADNKERDIAQTHHLQMRNE